MLSPEILSGGSGTRLWPLSRKLHPKQLPLLGTTHQPESTGGILLEIIEVQADSHLDEDEIVRFDDIYGRGRK